MHHNKNVQFPLYEKCVQCTKYVDAPLNKYVIHFSLKKLNTLLGNPGLYYIRVLWLGLHGRLALTVSSETSLPCRENNAEKKKINVFDRKQLDLGL